MSKYSLESIMYWWDNRSRRCKFLARTIIRITEPNGKILVLIVLLLLIVDLGLHQDPDVPRPDPWGAVGVDIENPNVYTDGTVQFEVVLLYVGSEEFLPEPDEILFEILEAFITTIDNKVSGLPIEEVPPINSSVGDIRSDPAAFIKQGSPEVTRESRATIEFTTDFPLKTNDTVFVGVHTKFVRYPSIDRWSVGTQVRTPPDSTAPVIFAPFSVILALITLGIITRWFCYRKKLVKY